MKSPSQYGKWLNVDVVMSAIGPVFFYFTFLPLLTLGTYHAPGDVGWMTTWCVGVNDEMGAIAKLEALVLRKSK